jgi:hypothetical protein
MTEIITNMEKAKRVVASITVFGIFFIDKIPFSVDNTLTVQNGIFI